MAQQPDIDSRAEAEFGKPELTLAASRDGPDPRLLALVRVLARRAARGLYEQQLKDHPASRS
ncbi:hypothetical protein ACDP63_03890 [Paracoccus sp. P2]|uniref:hypothetical protein n=1 Tax=Paracoccus sp. P2 TaxID=3248840 RepID=UPI00391FA669